MRTNCTVKAFFCLNLFLATSITAFSQKNYLKAGDVMPDYEFKHVYNNNGKPVKISDFKGKLLILDFWSTGCQSCIESWPKLNKLQNKYGDKIKILLVNAWQDSLKVSTTYRKWEAANKTKMVLASVYSDRTILDHFLIRGVPYIVWVDQTGKVHSITRGDVLNEKTIDSFLAGTPRRLPQITNERYDLKVLEPLYVNGNGGGTTPDDSHVLWQSVVGTYSPKMVGNSYIRTRDTLSFVMYTNCLVVDMIRFLLDTRMVDFVPGRVPKGRVELRVADTTKYLTAINREIIYENFYAYHLWTKRRVPEDVLRLYALEDIKRIFGLDVWWEKQMKKCLVLSSPDTTKLAYDGSPLTMIFRTDEAEWADITLERLMFDLESATRYYYSKYPLINEATYKGKVGRIRAEGDVEDYKILDREFSKYGLRFKLEEREIDVLVISEKNPMDVIPGKTSFYPALN